jgi:hypothetical protein
MTEQQSPLKIPCVVKCKGLSEEQAEDLYNKFIELGAVHCETPSDLSHACWEYFGVDHNKDTVFYDCLWVYSKDKKEAEVTLYTYNEVMNMKVEDVTCIESGWISWNGGECPVERGVNVEFEMMDGERETAYGSALDWDTGTEDWCIKAYRIIESEPTSKTQEYIKEFKEGVAVKIRKDSEYYGTDDDYNPIDTIGEIVSINPEKTEYEIEVKWSDYITNTYSYQDLEVVDYTSTVTSQDSITATLEEVATTVLPEEDNGCNATVGSNTAINKVSELTLELSFDSERFQKDFENWLIDNTDMLVQLFQEEYDLAEYIKVGSLK